MAEPQPEDTTGVELVNIKSPAPPLPQTPAAVTPENETIAESTSVQGSPDD